MNDHGHWSSKDIEQDVEDSRETIGSTLAELRSRMKPKQLASEALAYARQSGGASLLSGVGTKIRDNPVPAALIGAGVAWLIANRSGLGLNRLLGDSGDDGAYPQRMDLSAAKAYRPPRYDAQRDEPEPVVEENVASEQSEDDWDVELEYEDDSDDALATRASEALSESSSRASEQARELGNRAREPRSGFRNVRNP